jgi:DNA repair exonuclease SbcCD ATPase subunit
VRPLRLQLTNFGSFAEADIDLSEVTLAALVGENGSGKSTCLTAIAVALYGAAVAPLDGFIRQGAPAWRVAFTFEAGGQTYLAVREHGKAQKASLSRDSVPVCEAKVRDVDAAIVSLLGCDYAGYSLAHHLPQGALGAFAAMDPAVRKDWLIANLPMGGWSALERKAKDAATLTQQRLTGLRASRDTLTARLVDVDALGAEIAATKAAEASGADHLAALEARAASEAAEQAKRAELRAKVAAANDAMQAAIRREASVTDAIAKTGLLLSAAERVLTTAGFTTAPSVREQHFEVYDLDRLAARVEWYREAERLWDAAIAADVDNDAAGRAYAVFASEPEQTCPTCGQRVMGEAHERTVAKYRAETDAALARVTAATDALDAHLASGGALKCEPPEDAVRSRQALTAAQDAIEAARASERERAAAEQRKQEAALEAERAKTAQATAAAEAEGHRARLVELNAELAEAKSAAFHARNDYSNAQVLVDATAEGEMLPPSAIPESRRTLATLATERTRLEARLEASAEVRAEIDALASDITAAEARCDLLAMLVRAYGKSGIPARMVENTVATIESFANDYLGEFSDGLSISLVTQKETKSGTIRETLDLMVTDALGTRPIERFSGGEKVRVNFSIAIGLARFLSSLGDGQVDSFSIDEVDALDDRGLDELVRCLHVLARSVPCVLIVSHIPTLADAMPQKVAVTKGASGSKVVLSL